MTKHGTKQIKHKTKVYK